MARLLAFLLLGLAAPLASAAAQGARLQGPGRRPAADTLDAPPPSREDSLFRRREAARLGRRRVFLGRGAEPAVAGRPLVPPPLPVAEGAFEVLVQTDAPEYLVDEDGADPMWIRVLSERSGYLTLLSGGTGNGYTVLAPNDLLAQVPIEAGIPFDLPLRQWLQQGIELTPSLPAGEESSQQTLIAIVTDVPVPLPLFDWSRWAPAEQETQLPLRTFQAWLAGIPTARRGVGQVFYLVSRR